ncbi:MAG: hypothetical protein AAGG72_10540 [Pseudomonadota bacterium]
MIRYISVAIISLYTLSFVLLLFGRTLEQEFFPPVTPLEFVAIQRATGGSLIFVRFEKLRASCTPVKTGAFLTWFDDETHDVVPFAFNPPGKDVVGLINRPAGLQVTGPWFVGMAPDRVREHSRVVVQHNCWPLWITVTQFYP